jgi:hypothetical protein
MAGAGGSQVAAESQMVKNGDLVIQLDPENMQVIFGVLETKDIKPIVFDLRNGIIYNASFVVQPSAPTPGVAPP